MYFVGFLPSLRQVVVGGRQQLVPAAARGSLVQEYTQQGSEDRGA